MLNFEIEEMNIPVDDHVQKVRADPFWLYAASEWHRLYREYVPFAEGGLYTLSNRKKYNAIMLENRRFL